MDIIPTTDQRYVVARFTNSGIGDHLSCLIGSWYFAKRTGRTLIVDWRGSRFNDDPSKATNCFQTWFDVPGPTLAGVPVIAGDEVARLDWEGSYWPDKWTAERMRGTGRAHHTADEVAAVNRLVTSDEDRPEKFVGFNQWIDPWPSGEIVKELLAELHFAPAIRAIADGFREQIAHGAPMIAIHLRNGNGENIGARSAYWLTPFGLYRQIRANKAVTMHSEQVWGRFSDNMPDSLVGTPAQRSAERAYLRRVAQDVKRLRTQPGLANAVPILFTDAPHLVERMKAFLPDVRAFDQATYSEGAGPLHQVKAGDGAEPGVVDAEIVKQMFVELAVMRACSALVFMESGFSAIPRVELPIERMVKLKPTFVNRAILKLMKA